jgi:hypothetical protein
VFNIQGVGGTEIKGAAQFNYKDYKVSMSNVFFPPMGAVFAPNGETAFEFYPSAEGLKKAFKKIDRLVAKAAKEG